MGKRKSKRSKTKELFLETTGMTVETFLDTQCIGMGRREIKDKIHSITKGAVSLKSHSTVWYWVQDGYRDGTIHNFQFGKRKKRDLLDIQTKPQIKEEPIKVPVIEVPVAENKTQEPQEPQDIIIKEKKVPEKIVKINGILINIKFVCHECGHEHSAKTSCKSPKIIGLRALLCPECKKYGTCYAEFKFEGIKCRKALVYNGVYKKEEFVDKDINTVHNPFESVAHHTP